ncbi:SRPBCC family protein [Wenzhouxiangella marina]|uniref:Uncharacterized protein n=1 Tax=Wenzhouxiangella marina TaxID=1579979 RepID=A0A0K0XVU8_9GAMM|nr:SRPBCC family protein [Wenzhouxiangella marina]AKS41808.1 hypothetical protein WM2015_1436 [Wenzhouxiangella marina]MBB6086430.1 hypothetical protein [Wenzhouxiangella marina]
MARRLLSILLALVIVIILVGFFLPREVTVQRTRLIDAPPERVHAVLEDLRYFSQWSPWYARTPDAGYRLEGPSSGPGATLSWQDERGSGAGRLWIVASQAPESIDLKLELGDTEADNFFRIGPADGGSSVTWGMRMRFGTFDLTGRYIGLMLPNLVGNDYREGLDRLADYLDAFPGSMPPVPEGIEASDFPSRPDGGS